VNPITAIAKPKNSSVPTIVNIAIGRITSIPAFCMGVFSNKVTAAQTMHGKAMNNAKMKL
jgi:hypothetical protein